MALILATLICALGAALLPDAAVSVRVAFAAGGVIGGPVLFGGPVLLAQSIRAPRLQRDELRAEVARLRTPSIEPTDADLAQECSELGDAIQQFIVGRITKKPMLDLDPASGLPSPESEAFIRSKQLNHDLQTRRMYGERFTAAVFALVRSLSARDVLTDEERSRLNYPETIAEIDNVGEKLVQLGRRLRSPEKSPV